MDHVTFIGSTHLMNCDPVDICVIDKPDYLVWEEFTVVLRWKIRLGGFAGVELQGFSDPFSQDIECRIGLHDFCHGLLNQRFHPWNPAAECTETMGKTQTKHNLKLCNYIIITSFHVIIQKCRDKQTALRYKYLRSANLAIKLEIVNCYIVHAWRHIHKLKLHMQY